ncbi:tetratricopeptide repeat protein [Ulvibacter litoralis]|uniref:tetratricopeptide repeat protein n=1 Tax=Ulvibacter litoralis TaxID=227084 RepID=UPI000B88B9B6|nr:tetratricopeptide repeat protein [Ulvibacter litoralis]GHC66345.1 hypothetical protein GCM10008083_34120 [Ulvibacter litoralis]
MTENQIKRIKVKIAKIKKALAADKKHWGGFYHDGGGLRYLQPNLYIQIQDFTGALRYFNWFEKNFPEDMGTPLFIFEYALTLFKTNRIEKAEEKILELNELNQYLVDYYLDKNSITNIESNSDWQIESLMKYFEYKKDDLVMIDFTDWLTEYQNKN